MRTLRSIAKVIRSKNASPFELTLDILFNDRKDYELAKSKRAIAVEAIATAYRVHQERIKSIIYFDPGKAVKVSMSRTVPAGTEGDTDVYGAQQHAPLLDMEVDL
ncbi:MAG: DUF4387 domain-containing protein [Verrucomicrobiota bacterium]